MEFDGNNLVVYDRNRRARDTKVDACVRRWKELGRMCAVIFSGFEHVDMPLVRHIDEVECVRQVSNWLQNGTETRTLDLACCCLHKQFDRYCVVRDAEEYKLDLELEVHRRTKDHGFFFACHNLELFAVPPAKPSLFYALLSVF